MPRVLLLTNPAQIECTFNKDTEHVPVPGGCVVLLGAVLSPLRSELTHCFGIQVWWVADNSIEPTGSAKYLFELVTPVEDVEACLILFTQECYLLVVVEIRFDKRVAT